MHKNNSRGRQKRIENRLGETVRIASIVQKGMANGRSSYVEMRALERIVKHNINASIKLIRTTHRGSDSELDEVLVKIGALHGGYSEMLTPNGVLRKDELEELLSIDSEISTCLGMLESPDKPRERIREIVDSLKELVEERKKLVGSLRA